MKTRLALALLAITFSFCGKVRKTNDIQKQLPGEKEKLTYMNISKKVYDFGVIHSSDTTLFAKYYLKNVGNEKLIIKNINPDCICTNHSLSKSTIVPGDSALIELEFNPKGKFGKHKVFTTVKANTEAKMHALIFKIDIQE